MDQVAISKSVRPEGWDGPNSQAGTGEVSQWGGEAEGKDGGKKGLGFPRPSGRLAQRKVECIS